MEAVLGKSGAMGLVVVEGSRSTVTVFVLVSVYAVAVVLGTVVLSVTVDISDTTAGLGLDVVNIGVTADECVVASVVALVGCKAMGGGLLMVVGCTMELVICAAGVGGCRVVAVVVKSVFGRSEGFVVEVTQKRAVMAKGALLVLDVLGPKGLVVDLTAPVVHAVIPATVVDEASVTLTVDSGSSTSGLTVGGVGGPAVIASSGAAEVETATGRMGSPGAGGACDKVVCVPSTGLVVVILVVGPVC